MPRAKLSLHRPGHAALARWLAKQRDAPFLYAPVGWTRDANGDAPNGFALDSTTRDLGSGESVYRRACDALDGGAMFRLRWLSLHPDPLPRAAGTPLVVVARAFGLYWWNASRVVYIVDERDAETARHGFAYGTLPGHAELGEERFLVTWNRANDRVSFHILAFSRPRHPLARLGQPLARRLQRRFAREATAELARAVRGEAPRSSGSPLDGPP